MIRRALIIYCNNTKSGELVGPEKDDENYRAFLTSSLGGEWTNAEIRSLQNPPSLLVEQSRQTFLKGADYTFVIFSGHGCINALHNEYQYAELSDGDISIQKLVTDAPRQTIVFDSCRGIESFYSAEMLKSELNERIKLFAAGPSTRAKFDSAVLKAEEGITVLYSASKNQSSRDSDEGGVYLFSMLQAAKAWGDANGDANILPLNIAHARATYYMNEHFITKQVPQILPEKRTNYFPFAIRLKAKSNIIGG